MNSPEEDILHPRNTALYKKLSAHCHAEKLLSISADTWLNNHSSEHPAIVRKNIGELQSRTYSTHQQLRARLLELDVRQPMDIFNRNFESEESIFGSLGQLYELYSANADLILASSELIEILRMLPDNRTAFFLGRVMKVQEERQRLFTHFYDPKTVSVSRNNVSSK